MKNDLRLFVWLLILVGLILLARRADAGPLTNCVTYAQFTDFDIASATHVEVGQWHNDEAGCGATDEYARPSGGAYSVTYLDDGAELLRFLKAGIEACGRTQLDIRWRNSAGDLVRFDDRMVNAEVNCRYRAIIAAQGGAGWPIDPTPGPQPPPGPNPPYAPPLPPSWLPPACPGCSVDPHLTPVREPSSAEYYLVAVLGGVLVALMRRVRARG